MARADSPVALVTGSARGLGLATAHRLASDGFAVVLADINPDGAELESHALVEAGFSSIALSIDVTDDASVAAAVNAVIDHYGRLDVLVNNAGVVTRKEAEFFESAVWNRELDVHLGGAMRCSRAAFPYLRESPRAAIVNVASVGSTFGLPHRIAYSTAKTGVLGLTRTLASEWGDRGIRVNAVAPGYMNTEMLQSGLRAGNLDEGILIGRTPLRRFGTAEEVASAVSFLVSGDASFVTGIVLPVDGGITIDGTFHREAAR